MPNFDAIALRNIAFHERIFEDALRRTEGPFRKTLQKLAVDTSNNLTPSIEWHPTWSLVPFRDHLNPFEPPQNRTDEDLELTLRNVFGTALILAGGKGIWKLVLDSWSKIADRTPKEIEESTRPTPAILEEKMSRRDVLKLFSALQNLVEGDSEEYDK
ncbi:MAG: hypothetical protein JRE64_16075, partial [Deltaproteobacteria bacterium]|nr:hypothetical protein [Deltaproteobacteria bacterium]